MKISKYIYLGIFSALALTSCKEEDVKDPVINIQFPELKEHTMELNKQSADTIDITFDVPMKWDLTTTESKWVKFLDGKIAYSSLSGQSGKHTVEIVIQPNEGFKSDTATVDLSVAGEKKAVAKIVRGNTTPTLTIYLVDTNTGLETTLDNAEVSLEWNETNFMHVAQIKVEANYDWVMTDIPAWITKANLIQVGSAGQKVNISLRANYSGYTAEEMITDLVFAHKDQKDVQATIKLQTESLVGKVKLAESETEYFNGLTVNANGVVIYEENETSEFDLNILSGEAIHFMAYEGSIWDDQFYFGTVSDMGISMYPEADWLHIWEDGEENHSPAAILHKNAITIDKNEGKERIAGLLAIPQSLYEIHGDDILNYIDSEGVLKSEFDDAGCYITHVTQSAASGQGGLSFAFPSEGATIRPMTEEDGEAYFLIHYDYGVEENGVNQLTYANIGASETTFILTPGAVSASVPNKEHAWLKVEFMYDLEGQGAACMIMIDKDKLPENPMFPLQGQVVLQGSDGVNKYGINVVLEGLN